MRFKLSIFILLFTVTSISNNAFACDCQCKGDCSFSVTSKKTDFVALVKVIEFTDYLDNEILGYEGKMPFSMTLEIIKTYKGRETRKLIKVWGDNGMLCRPYISTFEIGNYYLIAPSQIDYHSDEGEKGDFYFSSCRTDYLKVDMKQSIAYGKYSVDLNKIELSKFECELEE